MLAAVLRSTALPATLAVGLAGCAGPDPTGAALSGLIPRGEIGGATSLTAEPAATGAMPAAQAMAAPTMPVTTASIAPMGAAAAPMRAPAGQAIGDVQFLPVVGAPADKAELLAGALSRGAQARGIAIRPASGPLAALRLKGYFSTLQEGRRTVLVYVWDVLDEKGGRVTRIQGQEIAGAAGADPWSAIDARVIEAVAQKTLGETATLLSRAG